MDIIKQETREFKHKDKTIIFEDLSLKRFYEVADRWQEIIGTVTKAELNGDTVKSREVEAKILDLCCEIVNKPFNLFNPMTWRKKITRKWLMKNATYSKIIEFMEVALEPLLGKQTTKRMRAINQILQ